MALVLKDRVRETTTTAGTGTVTLLGAVSGFQSFSVIGNTNTTYYAIVDTNTGDWEVGIGTYTLSGTTLSRDTVLESSNSNNLVNFAANTKDVFCTYPAEQSVYVSGSSIVPGTAATLPVLSGGTGQSSYTNGQLLIGNTTGNTLAKATLTAGTGINITNGAGSITIDNIGVASYPGAGIPLSTGSAWGTSFNNSSNPVSIAYGGTGKTTAPSAFANLTGFTSTATAGGTTTLTNASSYYQVFTGSSNQTVVLPATSTLATGWSFHIVNNSTGTLTVQTNVSVTLGTIPPGVTAMPTALTITGDAATDWEFGYTDFSTLTGTGAVVLATSPTLTTPSFSTIVNTGTLTLPTSTDTLVARATTDTLTNKRITPRIGPSGSTTSFTSPLNTWTSDSFDAYEATAQASNLTIAVDSGTPTDGQKITFRITSDATPRVITFTGGASKGFKPVGVTLTTSGSDFTYTLTASKTTYFGCVYNTTSARWEMVALSQEA